MPRRTSTRSHGSLGRIALTESVVDRFLGRFGPVVDGMVLAVLRES